MPAISAYAQKKKLEYFFGQIPKDAKILEVGCAEGWVGDYAKKNGWKNFVGLDIIKHPNVDIVGDVNDWQKLGLKPASFDFIIAFEVVEHGDFFKAFNALLKPGGKLFVTTPVPHMDWACKMLETLGLNQKRTSKHTHLTYLEKAPHFHLDQKQVKGFISQWGVFRKPLTEEATI